MIPALVLAALVGAEVVDRTRPRAQELAGRLGIAPARPGTGGDTRARLQYADRLYPARATRLALRDALGMATGVTHELGSQDPLGFTLEDATWLPRPGVRTWADPFLVHVARWLDGERRVQDEAVREGHVSPWSDPDRFHGPWLEAAVQALGDGLAEIRDWVAATRVDLGAYTTFPAVSQAVATWHRALRVAAGFRAPVPPGIPVMTWPGGWHMDRLVSRADLAAEGTSMGHCVGGPLDDGGHAPGTGRYWQALREGRINLVSLRDPAGIPWATIELDRGDGSIVQVQGPGDGPVPPGAAERVLAFLSTIRPAETIQYVAAHPAQVQAPPVLDATWIPAEMALRALVPGSTKPGSPRDARAVRQDLHVLLQATRSPAIAGADLDFEVDQGPGFPVRATFTLQVRLVDETGEETEYVASHVDGEVREEETGTMTWWAWSMNKGPTPPRFTRVGGAEALVQVLVDTGEVLLADQVSAWIEAQAASAPGTVLPALSQPTRPAR